MRKNVGKRWSKSDLKLIEDLASLIQTTDCPKLNDKILVSKIPVIEAVGKSIGRNCGGTIIQVAAALRRKGVPIRWASNYK